MHILKFITEAQNENDLVNHDILLLKLEKIGIRGIHLKWLESYLKNRKQVVMVNGVFSEFYTVRKTRLQSTVFSSRTKP